MATQALTTGSRDEDTAVKKAECGPSSQGPPKWRSTRFGLAYMVSTGLMVVFFQRVSFSMNIVCMVNHTALKLSHHHGPAHLAVLNISLNTGAQTEVRLSQSSDHVITTPSPDVPMTKTTMMQEIDDKNCQRNENDAANEQDGPFVWDKHLQGLLLGALYWGYTASQIPASYLIRRRGPRVVVGLSIVIMSLFHVLCHPAALLSPWAVFALRVGIGICSGMAIPGMYSVWGRWAPVAERATLLSMAFAGQMIANATVFPLSALLCQYGFWKGWPSVYYIFGVLGVFWSVLWFVIISDTPETHGRINRKEKEYIMNTRSSLSAHKGKVAVPWRSILTAPCFWAIAVSQFTYNWGFFLMLSNLPIFMYEAMKLDIQSNGAYSMLPYVFLFITMASAGFLSDFIVSRRLLSVIGARRFFTIIGYLTPAVLLIVMSHQHCSQVAVVVILLVVSVGMTGLANTAGFFVNPYDIAPDFAINIVSATNTLATGAGILNPYVVAYITADETKEQWQIVFYITAAIFTFGTIFFCILARGEIQPWAATSLVQEKIIAEPTDSTGKQDQLSDEITQI